MGLWKKIRLFEVFVAMRYLMAKRERNVLSVITMISVGGVAVGVMALIVVLSVMGGFEGDLREKILGTKSHVVITSEDGLIEDYESISALVLEVPEVLGASPYVEGEVMINSPSNLQGVVLHGVLPEMLDQVSDLADKMVEGSLEELNVKGPSHEEQVIHRLHQDPEDVVESSNDELATTQMRGSFLRAGKKHGVFVHDVLIAQYERLTSEKNPGDQQDPEGEDDQPKDGEIIEEDTPPKDRSPTDIHNGSSDPKVDPDQASGSDTDHAPDEDRDPLSAGSTLTGGSSQAQTKTRQPDPIPMVENNEQLVRKIGGLVIGQELMKNLNVYLSSEVNIMSPMADSASPLGPAPKSRPFRVVGVFYTGMYEYDTKYVYMTLRDAQNFLSIGDRVTGIDVKITEPDDSPLVKAEIEKRLADHTEPLVVRDWRELNANLFSALMLEKIAMFIILTFIILVASFSIICLLIMIVIEKAREIAIMKSMGATNQSVMAIFILQGGVIGALGTVIGCGLGLVLCDVISKYGIKLNPDVYYISQLPVDVRPVEVALICVSAVVISLLATIYPSIQAARLDPVEGLRYE